MLNAPIDNFLVKHKQINNDVREKGKKQQQQPNISHNWKIRRHENESKENPTFKCNLWLSVFD